MKDFFRRHLTSQYDRTAMAAAGGFLINLAMGVGQLAIGVRVLSVWIIVNACYFLLLCVTRGYVLWQYTRMRLGKNSSSTTQFLVYKRGGLFMAMTGGIYIIICILMLLDGGMVRYPGSGMILYFAVFLAFVKIGFSIRGIISARRLKMPIVSVLRMINVADAMVAVVIVQCSLLLDQQSPSAVTSSAKLGLGFGIVMIIMGICMLNKNRSLRTSVYSSKSVI